MIQKFASAVLVVFLSVLVGLCSGCTAQNDPSTLADIRADRDRYNKETPLLQKLAVDEPVYADPVNTLIRGDNDRITKREIRFPASTQPALLLSGN